MNNPRDSRRNFLKHSTAAGLSLAFGGRGSVVAEVLPRKPRQKSERLQIGCVGMRYQGTVIAYQAQQHGEIVAICDVDRNVREQARASFGSTPSIYEDYRQLIDRDDVDVITIGTPDHWHTKILIDACRAGKDVYCEKPLTLTIDEGKLIRNVVRSTASVVQVGSWQRSGHRFRLATELVRQGRIGNTAESGRCAGQEQAGRPLPHRRPSAGIELGPLAGAYT